MKTSIMADGLIDTPRLILRNWRDSDRDLFHRINSDETVMEFFPFRRDRNQADEVMDQIADTIRQRGYGFAAIALKDTEEPIGFCGLNDWQYPPLFPKGSVEIGWRLAPEHWGKGYVTEAATHWLDYGFTELDLEEIVSFAVPKNHRSLAVMKRLGMIRDPERDFDHPGVSEDYAHLKRHIVHIKNR